MIQSLMPFAQPARAKSVTPAQTWEPWAAPTATPMASTTPGQVVGWSDEAGNDAQHAFRTTANGDITALSDLGTLGGSYSEAYAINSSGEAVGYSYTGDNTPKHAFVDDVTGPMLDLNNLVATWQRLGAV